MGFSLLFQMAEVLGPLPRSVSEVSRKKEEGINAYFSHNVICYKGLNFHLFFHSSCLHILTQFKI